MLYLVWYSIVILVVLYDKAAAELAVTKDTKPVNEMNHYILQCAMKRKCYYVVFL